MVHLALTILKLKAPTLKKSYEYYELQFVRYNNKAFHIFFPDPWNGSYFCFLMAQQAMLVLYSDTRFISCEKEAVKKKYGRR